MRYYQRQRRYDLVDEWSIRLSKIKRNSLLKLLERTTIVAALDSILDWPGLWKDLKLGYVKKILAVGSDELIANYFYHIRDIYDIITLRNPEIRCATDVQTVFGVQLQLLAHNEIDRQHIIHEMENKTLFPSILDENLRMAIKQAILSVSVIIPSFQTFHQNFKFLEIGAKIIRNNLIEEPTTSLYEMVNIDYTLPEHAFVEVEEGEFRLCNLPQGQSLPSFTYRQMFVAALREFPRLCEVRPRKEINKRDLLEITATNYYSLFSARARLWGYRCGKLGVFRDGQLVYTSKTEYTANNNWEAMNRRMGVLFFNSYKEFRIKLFLPNLTQTEVREGPSVMFVIEDFINAFLGVIALIRICYNTPPIRIWSTTDSPATIGHQTILHRLTSLTENIDNDALLNGDDIVMDDVIETGMSESTNSVEDHGGSVSAALSSFASKTSPVTGNYATSLSSANSRTSIWREHQSFLIPDYLQSNVSSVNSDISIYSRDGCSMSSTSCPGDPACSASGSKQSLLS
jgi:hypothetical protein